MNKFQNGQSVIHNGRKAKIYAVRDTRPAQYKLVYEDSGTPAYTEDWVPESEIQAR